MSQSAAGYEISPQTFAKTVSTPEKSTDIAQIRVMGTGPVGVIPVMDIGHVQFLQCTPVFRVARIHVDSSLDM